MEPQGSRASRIEAWVALLVALVLAAVPIRAALFDADTLLFGVDTACAQLPWATGAPANPELAEQGERLYPAYREVSRRWRDGELPLWNPWSRAGEPLLAEPQLGALDPQVLLPVALEALTGRRGFDRGLTWMAWLRIAAAGLGAYLLARELGLAREGAALAGITFGGSGAVVLLLNHGVGHVAPLLPWVLLGVERSRSARGLLGCAFATALAIYGGDPGTSFCVAAAAGTWAFAILRRDRGHGLRALAALVCGVGLAAPLLVPYAESLTLSAAGAARALPALDLVALGALLVAGAWARDLRGALEVGPGRGARIARNALFAALLVGLAATVEWPASLALLVQPDLWGTPAQARGWRGAGSFLEQACAWVPAASVALGLAAALAPPAPDGLRRRGVLLSTTLVALALALRLPGLAALQARLPGLDALAPASLAVVGALGLGLLAGEALERAPRVACAAAALVVALGALAAVLAPRPELPTATVAADPADGLFEVVRPLPASLDGAAPELELRIHPGLPEGPVRLEAERLEADGSWRGASEAPWPLSRDDGVAGAGAPAGARGYRLAGVDARALADGTWRMRLVLDGPDGARLGDRVLGAVRVERRARPSVAAWLFLAAGLLAVARLGAQAGVQARRLALAVAALQALSFAEGQNPAIELERVFPPTRTESILREVLAAGGRFLAEPGICPPGTSLAFGLRCADGYGALDPQGFELLRAAAVKRGVPAQLGLTPSGVDLASPAFQLLGVHALLTRAPFERPGWTTIAGPGLARDAEVYVTTPDAPPPRAFLVGRARTLSDVASPWISTAPFQSGTVTPTWVSSGRIELDLDLEGDALLVVTEQVFPGWHASVDGTAREFLTLHGGLGAVPVRAGESSVVLEFRPVSTRIGLALFALSVLAGALVARRASRSAA